MSICANKETIIIIIRFESYLTNCRHVIVLYCNLMGYPSNLVGTGGGRYYQKYEDVYVQVLIAFND